MRVPQFQETSILSHQFLFQLAIFGVTETSADSAARLLVGHDATTHEVTLQGAPVIVDHLKMEIIALLVHGFHGFHGGVYET